MNRSWWLLLALFGSGCGTPSGVAGSGDQHLGSYALKVKGIFFACSLPGIPDNYEFQGTFSRFSDGGRVIFSDSQRLFDGGFDGQFASFGESVKDRFGLSDGGTCDPCEMKFSQTGLFALLSPSQGAALGGMCPTTALDGGVPAAKEDAGLALPGFFAPDGGFDAVRACGELVVQISGEGRCDPVCYSCKAQYRVSGERTR